MGEKTFAQLGGISTPVQDADLFAAYRGSGPLTKVAASDLKTYINTGAGAGDLLAANNLSDVANTTTSRTNLGLGSAAVLDEADVLLVANNLSDIDSASSCRTNLGLGTMATQAASAVAITGGSIAGITDLAVADGGTGASTAANARTNLGLGTIATAAATAYAAGANNLSDLASASTARTNLGLGSLATASTINNGNWSGTDLAVTNGGTGASDASGARTNLGLGSLATASTINNSNWSGTDLAVANGGTGASDAETARANLGIGGPTIHSSGFTDNTAGPTFTTYSYNGEVSSATGTGNYQVTFDTPAASANYAVNLSGTRDSGTAGGSFTYYDRQTTGFKIHCENNSGSGFVPGSISWTVSGPTGLS